MRWDFHLFHNFLELVWTNSTVLDEFFCYCFDSGPNSMPIERVSYFSIMLVYPQSDKLLIIVRIYFLDEILCFPVVIAGFIYPFRLLSERC